ncbi:glutamate--cysteine ligase [Friedmanniomyces endolithicus]|uniref:Glutamate--cysteine ligase n=1 Tax=Friedmanniomyces endolithicus TaxID=329885 RepID=A0AAN6J538_9PEZI|nr:glutamate--cysteine ligase [Friedmanniomyces endolithicus]KAK0280626.1 glutamate--cysteine ligase [Friedmanniomyces endolithicus]KAK0317510.1 glutamate--cysteine ligase [Friedmanniomyces endolithicus]KAK0983192.1 glutamate--cysteine ligase [Friedmanniomyces endolithicus]
MLTITRPQLPALHYLDIDKVKREEEAYHNRYPAAQTLPPVTTATSTYPYPTGPPPPYSQPSPATTHHSHAWPGAHANAHTPPESRRKSRDEHDAKQATRQSLPSISEALGVDGQTSYHHTSTSTSVPHPPASQTAVAPASPSIGVRRYGMDPPPAPTQSYAGSNGTMLPPHTHASKPPPLHVQTASPAHQQQHSIFTYPSHTSPSYEHPSSQPASSIAPPGIPYGYTPYPPRYAQPAPPFGVASGPIYQPSVNYPAPPPTPSTSWRSDSSTKYAASESGPGDYSASVKRHLDMYDLEGALSEIGQTSGILADFTRRYGDRLHQTARSGTPLSSLPGLVEVNDMISKSRSQVEALLKIRDVVLAQQVAYDQQLSEDRPAKHAVSEPPCSDLDPVAEVDDSKAGFAGSDTKKRRGRAAPPGRCHSCNRAETPEWRRGPDGARTLCNACGLHYAKLTRKQQGAHKTAGAGSSTLTAKDS